MFLISFSGIYYGFLRKDFFTCEGSVVDGPMGHKCHYLLIKKGDSSSGLWFSRFKGVF